MGLMATLNETVLTTTMRDNRIENVGEDESKDKGGVDDDG